MNRQTNDKEAAPVADTARQSELIAALGAIQQIANIASWLNMRCCDEYDVGTTLTILERKIKTLRQRMMLADRLRGREPLLYSADDPIMAGQDISL